MGEDPADGVGTIGIVISNGGVLALWTCATEKLVEAEQATGERP